MRGPRDWSVISQDIWQELLVIRLNKKLRAKQKRIRWTVQFYEAGHPHLPEIESLPQFLAWEQRYFSPGEWNATKLNHLTNARSWTKDSPRFRVIESGSDRHAVQQRIEKRLGVQSGISTLSFRSNWKRKCAFPRTSQSSSSNLAVISRSRACHTSWPESRNFLS